MSTVSYSWLPDRHLGVVATLAHADELIGQLAEVLFGYQAQPRGIIELDEVLSGVVSQTVVVGLAPMPRKVPLLVADVLVTLRNAIEHTVFAEVEHLDGTLTPRAAQRVEMPAAKTYETFQTWIAGRKKTGPKALLPGSELLRRIEVLQPFQRWKDPENHPLALLAAHTNHSKHRAPSVTAVRLAAMHRDDRPLRSMRDIERRAEVPLRIGDVIAQTPLGQKIPMTLFPAIGINRPGTDRWPVVIKELDDLATWVRLQAIPQLINGSDRPSPALPARYDIDSGHLDDRRAVTSGTVTTAAQSYGERLQAASLRVDLVETIGMTANAPGAIQIRDWLASLSDRELVSRAKQMRLASNREPKVGAINIAVIERMRDDARAFGSTTDPEHPA